MSNKISWFKRLFMSWEAIEKHINDCRNDKFSDLQREYIDNIKQQITDKDQNIQDLKITISKLERDLERYKFDSESKTSALSKKEQVIFELRSQVGAIKSKLDEKIAHNANIQEEINHKLSTLSKIERTFFAASGNKGKGELGEMQVKTILSKSGLSPDFWVENLQVGSATVEFAMRSAERDKWIPVDSKVLDPKLDDEGKAIIDKSYKTKVKTQAKEISKYLNKTNTSGYGILVLQSDSIYMNLYDTFPHFFQEVLRDHQVHIASPSSFVQAAWSISQIVDIYEQIHGDQKIYQEMLSALNTVTKFANTLQKVHVEFNKAMNSHYPALEKKQLKLSNKLEKTGKITDIKSIGGPDEQPKENQITN